MAEKTAVFSVRVDTGNSVNDINSFDKSLENLNKEVNATHEKSIPYNISKRITIHI
jgi:hypothetical protein